MEGDRIRAVSDLPAGFRPVYAQAFRYFNFVQSESFPHAFGSSYNMVRTLISQWKVLSAPTGSGKTGVMELAILGLLTGNLTEAGKYRHKSGCLKAVYLAPSRALVQERVNDWRAKFEGNLGLKVLEVTGDTDVTDVNELDAADIICITPEKFDSLTRGGEGNTNTRFFSEIALVLIDEVHLLNEDRGSALEAGVVSRIKMVSQFRELRETVIASVRFVAVSATIPNAADIARWLNAPPQGLLTFGEEARPVKLQTIVRGYSPMGATKSDFLFERRLDDYLPGIISNYSCGQPALVFCSSRKGTVDTAVRLAEKASQPGCGSIYVRDSSQHAQLEAAALQARHKQLAQALRAGVGFHYAAMEQEDRTAVEQLFLGRLLPVLSTTSTLAVGVNLPARLVVLKGTRRWSGDCGDASGYKEYDRSTCLQMIGRAGRPQFDTHGTAVIMTQVSKVSRYQHLTAGAELLESQLKGQLAEYLNAEIVLLTVTDISMAINWLKSTFLYIRMRANPQWYGLQPNLASAEAFDKMLMEKLVLATARTLEMHELVLTDEDGFTLRTTIPGRLMAHHYISLKTMIAMLAAPTHASIPDLLMLLAKSQEFEAIKLRRGEKKVLNAINKSVTEGQIRFCVTRDANSQKHKERISSGPEKIFILVNDALSDEPSEVDYSMKQELAQVFRVGARIVACMTKLYAHRKSLAAAANATLLAKCLRQRMWDISRLQCRQVPGITRAMAKRLAEAGLSKLLELQAADPRRIEALAQRHYPFGNQIKEQLQGMMSPPITLELTPKSWLPGKKLSFQLRLERRQEAVGPVKSFAKMVAGSIHDDCLLLCESLCMETFPSPYTVSFATRTAVQGQGDVIVVASIIHEGLIGLDTSKKLTVPYNAILKAAVASQPQQNAILEADTANHAAAEPTSFAQNRQPDVNTAAAQGGHADVALAEGRAATDEDNGRQQQKVTDIVIPLSESDDSASGLAEEGAPVEPAAVNPSMPHQESLEVAAKSSKNFAGTAVFSNGRQQYTPPNPPSLLHLPHSCAQKQHQAGQGGAIAGLKGQSATATPVGNFERFRFDSTGSTGIKRPKSMPASKERLDTQKKEQRIDFTLQIVQDKARKLMEAACRGAQGGGYQPQLMSHPMPSTADKLLSKGRVSSRPLAPTPFQKTPSSRFCQEQQANAQSLPSNSSRRESADYLQTPVLLRDQQTGSWRPSLQGKSPLETLLEENEQQENQGATLGASNPKQPSSMFSLGKQAAQDDTRLDFLDSSAASRGKWQEFDEVDCSARNQSVPRRRGAAYGSFAPAYHPSRTGKALKAPSEEDLLPARIGHGVQHKLEDLPLSARLRQHPRGSSEEQPFSSVQYLQLSSLSPPHKLSKRRLAAQPLTEEEEATGLWSPSPAKRPVAKRLELSKLSRSLFGENTPEEGHKGVESIAASDTTSHVQKLASHAPNSSNERPSPGRVTREGARRAVKSPGSNGGSCGGEQNERRLSQPNHEDEYSSVFSFL